MGSFEKWGEGKARVNGDKGVDLCLGGPEGGRLGKVEGGGITVSDEAKLRVRGPVGTEAEAGKAASKVAEPPREGVGAFTLPPHVVQDALDLTVRWQSSFEVAYYEVFMEIYTYLEHFIRYEHSRPSILCNRNRSKPLESLILQSSDLFN
ncbi:hypothetical protein F2Q68_00040683 [Brassica cretica]|uniref:Uncharacterized protein n=1 Tax=Brassica cretica TaxID=69181 RepID=A0A8S9MD17_BRACR|nr:hypothetical protein F2Q68_00040683 [Brassica cretica]